MLLAVWIGAVAVAGCAVNPNEQSELLRSGLVVVGEVVALDVVALGDVIELRHHVAIQRSWKGSVASGYLRLDSTMSGAVCPPPGLYLPGQQVYVVATPDDAGVVPLSICERRIGAFDEARRSWLVGLARGQGLRHSGSAAPPSPGTPAPLRDGDGRWVRIAAGSAVTIGAQVLAPSPEPIEAEQLEAGEGSVRALVTSGGWRLEVQIPAEGLARTTVQAVGLSPSLTVLPGAPILIRPDGTAYLQPSWVSDPIEVPAEALGTSWIPEAPPAGAPAGWHVEAPTDWFDQPGGEPVGRLSPHGGHVIAPRGSQRDGWLPVQIVDQGLAADGWLRPGALVRGHIGGVAGGVVEGTAVLGTPRQVEAGSQIVDATGHVFAEAVASATLSELFSDASQRWVWIETPWGRVAGSMSP